MPRFVHGLVLASALAAGTAYGGEGFEAGIIVGDPTGLSMKFWLERTFAVDLAIDLHDDATYFHADFLGHDPHLFHARYGEMLFYYGLGVGVKMWDESAAKDDELSVRVPFGLSYLAESAPFDIFLQIVPRVEIAPDTDFHVGAAIGLRFYIH